MRNAIAALCTALALSACYNGPYESREAERADDHEKCRRIVMNRALQTIDATTISQLYFAAWYRKEYTSCMYNRGSEPYPQQI